MNYYRVFCEGCGADYEDKRDAPPNRCGACGDDDSRIAVWEPIIDDTRADRLNEGAQ